MEKTAKKAHMSRRALAALVVALSLVLLAVIALGGVSVYYRSAFLPGTVINGYDCGGSSAAGAADYLLGVAGSHAAQLRDAEGDAIVALPLESFVDGDGFTAAVQEFFAAQHEKCGLFGWMAPGEQTLDAPVYAVSDAAAASELLSRALYDDTPRTEPVDARIVPGEDGYTVDPGAKGNLVNLSHCVAALTEQLPALRDLREESPVVSAQGGVIRQKVAPDSPALLRQQERIDGYLSTEVTLDFADGSTYTLTPDDIWRMSEFDVSALVKPGRNRIAVLCVKWSVSSYLEDQDMWRMSGIFREVYLLARGKDRIVDFYAKTALNEDFSKGEVSFEIEKKDLALRFRGSSNQRLIDVPKTLAAGTVVLWDDGWQRGGKHGKN